MERHNSLSETANTNFSRCTAGQPLPEQLPVVQNSGESVPLVTVKDGGSKRQKQKTSGASVSATMDTSRLSSSYLLNMQGG